MKLKSFCTAKGTINKPESQTTEGENIFASHISDKGIISQTYKEHKQLNNKEKIQFKNGQKNQIDKFFQRRHPSSQQVLEKMLIISNNQRNTNQNHNAIIISHLLEWLSSHKQEITSVDKDVEKREHLYTADGNVNWFNCYGKQYGDASKN